MNPSSLDNHRDTCLETRMMGYDITCIVLCVRKAMTLTEDVLPTVYSTNSATNPNVQKSNVNIVETTYEVNRLQWRKTTKKRYFALRILILILCETRLQRLHRFRSLFGRSIRSEWNAKWDKLELVSSARMRRSTLGLYKLIEIHRHVARLGTGTVVAVDPGLKPPR